MRNIDKLKSYLKETAIKIRQTREQYKQAQRANLIQTANKFLWQLRDLQYEYRHHHIAYSELRGKTREQIEPKTRDNHKPNETYIRQLKKEYAWTQEEIEAYNERKEKHEALCA